VFRGDPVFGYNGPQAPREYGVEYGRGYPSSYQCHWRRVWDPLQEMFFFHFWVSKYVERVITDVQRCPTVVLTEHKLLAACATDQLSNQ